MQIVSLIFSLIVVFVIFEMLRKRKIKEEYSILWFFIGGLFLIISLFPQSIDYLGNLLGISYSPTIILLIFIAFIFLVLIHFSVVISRIQNQNKDLIQEIGLLKKELDDCKTS